MQFLKRWGPILWILFYWSVLWKLHGLRSDHIWTTLLIVSLYYLRVVIPNVFPFFLPLYLTGVVYDSQRFYSDFIRGTIHIYEPYHFDHYFFGIQTALGKLTPNEFFQIHTFPVLDLISGFFYLTFIALFVLFCAMIYFYYSKHGTHKCSASVIYQKRNRLMWAFFWVNVIGYSTYYWYPAAPPWYTALYGFGPANLHVKPFSAGCLRFDALLGTHFFQQMYGRSADVFGAIPSLHVAYPLQAVYYAFQFGALRTFSVLFYMVMCFSAVYLNHHYILDILWGSVYAILVTICVDRYYDKKEKL